MVGCLWCEAVASAPLFAARCHGMLILDPATVTHSVRLLTHWPNSLGFYVDTSRCAERNLSHPHRPSPAFISLDVAELAPLIMC